jgi:hydroxyacylglutathione hydrolase
MAKLDVHQFPARSDNYGVLIHDPETGATASIDAPDADAVLAALEATGWTLTHILITHHHGDHTAGNKRLKAATGCIVVGPAAEARSIPAIDVEVSEGDSVAVGNSNALVIETPGHTRGHVSYLFPEDGIVFVGDTLFSVGCGKLLEGDARMMWRSLQKLMALPPETQLYCGHEYTRANARFALTVEPGNEALQARAAEAEDLAGRGEPALPTTIAKELATNPFLRPSSPEIQERLGMQGRELWEIFGETRKRKDRF